MVNASINVNEPQISSGHWAIHSYTAKSKFIVTIIMYYNKLL